jgi:transposase
LTDEEWRLVEPLLPAPKRTGRPLRWPLREIFNAIFYVMRGGVAWRLLPSDLPPKSTAYRWFAAWRDKGVFEALNHGEAWSSASSPGSTETVVSGKMRRPQSHPRQPSSMPRPPWSSSDASPERLEFRDGL